MILSCPFENSIGLIWLALLKSQEKTQLGNLNELAKGMNFQQIQKMVCHQLSWDDRSTLESFRNPALALGANLRAAGAQPLQGQLVYALQTHIHTYSVYECNLE